MARGIRQIESKLNILSEIFFLLYSQSPYLFFYLFFSISLYLFLRISQVHYKKEMQIGKLLTDEGLI